MLRAIYITTALVTGAAALTGAVAVQDVVTSDSLVSVDTLVSFSVVGLALAAVWSFGVLSNRWWSAQERILQKVERMEERAAERDQELRRMDSQLTAARTLLAEHSKRLGLGGIEWAGESDESA